MNVKTFFIILAVIAIAAGGAIFLFLQKNKESDINKRPSGFIIGENAIYATEQSPSQNVLVSVARLEKLGFAAIYEDSNGAPGKILGASGLLTAGETNSFRITLARSTADGETAYAMLYFDDGDKVFDPAKDKPVLDRIGGEPMMTIIVISKDAIEPNIINP